MDSTTNFSLRFAQGLESKAETPDRALSRHILRRIAIRTSLLCLAIGFSILGTLIILNRHQADLNGLPGGNFIAVVGGTSAILIGAVFLSASFFHWRFCAKRSASFSRSTNGPSRLSRSNDPSLVSTGISLGGGNHE